MVFPLVLRSWASNTRCTERSYSLLCRLWAQRRRIIRESWTTTGWRVSASWQSVYSLWSFIRLTRLIFPAGWLDDIGLPQYKTQFDEGRVDGRMLHYMTVVSVDNWHILASKSLRISGFDDLECHVTLGLVQSNDLSHWYLNLHSLYSVSYVICLILRMTCFLSKLGVFFITSVSRELFKCCGSITTSPTAYVAGRLMRSISETGVHFIWMNWIKYSVFYKNLLFLEQRFTCRDFSVD